MSLCIWSRWICLFYQQSNGTLYTVQDPGSHAIALSGEATDPRCLLPRGGTGFSFRLRVRLLENASIEQMVPDKSLKTGTWFTPPSVKFEALLSTNHANTYILCTHTQSSRVSAVNPGSSMNTPHCANPYQYMPIFSKVAYFRHKRTMDTMTWHISHVNEHKESKEPRYHAATRVHWTRPVTFASQCFDIPEMDRIYPRNCEGLNSLGLRQENGSGPVDIPTFSLYSRYVRPLLAFFL